MSNRSVPSLGDADDRSLAGRAADGDVRAFEILVRRYGPMMRAYATRIMVSNEASDDVVQEAFITAWQRLPSLENSAAIKSWLMRIVSHKSIDHLRARRIHDDIDDQALEAPRALEPDRRAEIKSQEQGLSSALAALPEDQQRCWALKEIASYSYDDIAEELGVPVSTVRGLLARARKTLTREMEEWR